MRVDLVRGRGSGRGSGRIRARARARARARGGVRVRLFRLALTPILTLAQLSQHHLPRTPT